MKTDSVSHPSPCGSGGRDGRDPLDPGLLSLASPWKIPVQVVEEITSTNDELLRLGEDGCPEGVILFTESQTAGRGRHQRPWASAPGLGLWFSLLLRMKIGDDTIPALSAFAAVSIVETLKGLGLHDCGIKEPNDVLVSARKVAGILIETRIGANPFAVVGIGLNVNHTPEDFPMEIREQASSFHIATGTFLERIKVASILLTTLGKNHRIMQDDPSALLAKWRGMLVGEPSRITA